MGGLLALIGAAGFIGCIIWLIVCIRNWDSKIPPIIGALLCLVMAAGGLMWRAETEPPRERKPASERSEPAENKENTPVEEDAIERRTHEIHLFGIEFDFPAAFGTEGKSNVAAEDEVDYPIGAHKMGGLLALIGAAGFIGCIIWLIVCIRNWDSKIPPIIGALLCLVMAAGGLMWRAETEPPRERKPASERSEPEGTREAAPVKGEDAVECRTYEIPFFGIEFDCPASFGTEGSANVIAEDEVNYSIGTEDSALLFTCSRISSLSRMEELFQLAGKDPAILYEEFESLDLADGITSRSEQYRTFDLLDSFSSPESYGFFYVATDDSFGELDTEMGYRYKNYGGFVDDGGIINIVLSILVPEDTDREDFSALCETVTNSIRFSEARARGGAPQDVAGDPVPDNAYEETCWETMHLFWGEAPLVRKGGSPDALMRLLGGNKDLFNRLQEQDGILDNSRSFTSEWSFQGCWVSDTDPNTYNTNVNEIRKYDLQGLEPHAFAHTFTLSKPSSGDHYISAIESDDKGTADVSYEVLPAYDEPIPEEAEALPLDRDAYLQHYTHLNAPELQHTYGTNSKIRWDVFNTVILNIEAADIAWADQEFTKASLEEKQGYYGYEMSFVTSIDDYDSARQIFETFPEYKDTPMYEYVNNLWLFGPLWDSARLG